MEKFQKEKKQQKISQNNIRLSSAKHFIPFNLQQDLKSNLGEVDEIFKADTVYHYHFVVFASHCLCQFSVWLGHRYYSNTEIPLKKGGEKIPSGFLVQDFRQNAVKCPDWLAQ